MTVQATSRSPRSAYLPQIEETAMNAAEEIARLKKEPLLKAICAGHLHITISDEFSPTAKEYVVGGNFLFHGQEILFT